MKALGRETKRKKKKEKEKEKRKKKKEKRRSTVKYTAYLAVQYTPYTRTLTK
jgi:hypothetical protein